MLLNLKLTCQRCFFDHPFVNGVRFYKFRAGNNLNPSTLNQRNPFQLHLIGLGGDLFHNYYEYSDNWLYFGFCVQAAYVQTAFPPARPVPAHILFTPQPSGLEGYCHHGSGGGQVGGWEFGRLGCCRNCGTLISVTTWRIFSIRSFVELVKFATNLVQTLRNVYLWNCWMDLPHLKFHGLV